MSGALLHIDAVEKRFGSIVAVDRVSAEVEEGEIFALLGPNGAGKTTLIRMLIGLTHPDGGTIRYAGPDGGGTRTLPPGQVGYLPEERGLYQDVEVLRTLVYFGMLRGMGRASAETAAQAWLDRMGLGDRSADQLNALSKGNQQKVQFISAVLHRPRFAVLDEPFSGLDPVNQDFFLDLIRELRDGGTTVMISAHQMQLIERVADRIVVLGQGRTVLSGSLSEIRRRWRTGTRILLRLGSPPDPSVLSSFEPAATARLLDSGEVELFVPDGRPLGESLVKAGTQLDIQELESHPVTLHDVYVGAVAGASGERAP